MRILNFIRYKNLLIIIFTQLLVFQFLISDSCFIFKPDNDLFLLIISSVLIAASANMVNDFFDIKIDMVNKPNHVIIGNGIRKEVVIITCVFLNLITIGIGIYLSNSLLLIFILAIGLTYLYSALLKKVLIIGNIVVSLLLALSLFILYIYRPQGSFTLICFYSFFAFFTGFIREIVKDTEDILGDKIGKCKTIPIVFGVDKTKIILYILLIVLIISLAAFITYLIVEGYIIAAGYVLIFLLGFTILILLKLRGSKTSEDFSKLSSAIKYLVIIGLLSMLFLCF